MTTITIDRSLLEQALKALNWFVTKEMTLGQRYTNGGQGCLDAIAALRSALDQPAQKRPQNCGTGYCSCIECVMEQPQQKPVFWEYKHVDDTDWNRLVPRSGQTLEVALAEIHGYRVGKRKTYEVRALYTHPAPRTEPVAWMMVNPTHLPSSRSLHWEPQDWHITWQAVPLYTAPPHTEQPRLLTDEEIDQVMPYCHNEFDLSDFRTFARAIEARILMGGKT